MKRPDEYENLEGDYYLNNGKNVPQFRSSWVRSRYYDPDWLVKKLVGVPLPDFPYVVSKDTWHSPSGKITWNGNDLGVSDYNTRYGPVNMRNTTSLFENSKNEALRALYKNANKLRSGNLGVSLAELKETIGFIGSTAARLAIMYKSLRKGDVQSASRALGLHPSQKVSHVSFPSGRKHKRVFDLEKDLLRKYPHMTKKEFLASSWLEYKYAWTPMILDCYDLAKAAAYANAKPEYDVVYRGKGSYEVTDSKGEYFSINQSTRRKWSHNGNIKVKTYLDAKFLVENHTLRNLNNLGLLNPAVITWELVPFSFVVDWFVPVGDYLQSLTAFQGLKYVRGVKSIKLEALSNNTFEHDGNWSSRYEHNSNRRSLEHNVPPLVSPGTSFADALKIPNALTALSLLTVLTKGK